MICTSVALSMISLNRRLGSVLKAAMSLPVARSSNGCYVPAEISAKIAARPPGLSTRHVSRNAAAPSGTTLGRVTNHTLAPTGGKSSNCADYS